MMQNLWQKKLRLSYSKDVIDIVQFGSSVMKNLDEKGNKEINDIDIGVIFNKIPVKKQLEERQKIKKQIQKYTSLLAHIESFDFYSFFDKSNFARQGILFYGKSLISGKNFSENFGLVPKLRISYSLSDLEKKDKVRFNYLISGKKGSYGLLRKYNGKLIYPGVVEICPEYENIFLEKMRRITNNVSVEKCFVFNE